MERPEILIFGTGRFLRGFAVDLLAAEAVDPKPRITLVQSTGTDRCDAINRAGGRYPLAVRGLWRGRKIDSVQRITAVERAFAVPRDWEALLEAVCSPSLRLIVSNVTEAGLSESERAEDPSGSVPTSFVGRLAALLWTRYRTLGAAGPVALLPCELVARNGAWVGNALDELAARWGFGEGFESWRRSSAPALTTLVDRIVTAPRDDADLAAIAAEADAPGELAVVAEPFALWAIERPARGPARDIADACVGPFADGDRLRLVDDVSPIADRKVTLLNGTHTACAAMAVQLGVRTVRELAEDRGEGGAFLRGVLLQELRPVLDRSRPGEDHAAFADAVLERFANPFIEHLWADIAAESTAKAAQRLLPALARGVVHDRSMSGVGAGLAAILSLHRPGQRHEVRDGRAERVRAAWQRAQGAPAFAPALAEAAVDLGVFGDAGSFEPRMRAVLVDRLASGLDLIGGHSLDAAVRWPPLGSIEGAAR